MQICIARAQCCELVLQCVDFLLTLIQQLQMLFLSRLQLCHLAASARLALCTLPLASAPKLMHLYATLSDPVELDGDLSNLTILFNR